MDLGYILNICGVDSMRLFGLDISKVEKSMLDNSAKTKKVFPEETRLIEFGLKLMWDLTAVTSNAQKDYAKNPNLYANTNIFGRNRQLLVNVYCCLLSAHYGTAFVLSRTVLENNNLMRLFNKDARYAFEWLPSDKQKDFSPEVKSAYKECKEKKEFPQSWVIKEVFGEEKQKKVKKATSKIYDQLCDYTHPNFLGWQELMGIQGSGEVLLELPVFVGENTDNSMKVILFLMQYSFKTFVETFKPYLQNHDGQLSKWQSDFKKIMPKYTGK